MWRGELTAAQSNLEQGLTLYDLQQHRALIFRHGEDLGVGCLSHATFILWVLGYPDQAQQRINDTLALAHELSHPFSLARASGFAATLHQLRREGPAAQVQAEEVIALATAQGFPHWLGHGTIFRGWALTAQGYSQEGIVQLREGITAYHATGAEVARPYFLGLLAEAYGQGGQGKEGLTVLATALAIVNTTGERFNAAELHRLQGELLLQQAGGSAQAAEAEACFHQALAIARHQQAKSWELRAALSLARLWQRQGKCTAAYELLAPVYGWFTEGFDTADLQEAKALLAELARCLYSVQPWHGLTVHYSSRMAV